MINKNIVSLITPCFNGEKFLNNYIKNIIEQTYCDKIELIFVDDGSTDHSRNIIMDNKDKLEEKFWKFIFIEQENQGVGSAVNNALKYITGEFITLLDVDDFMMPNSIEKRATWLKNNPKYSAVLSNGFYLHDNRNKSLFYTEQNHPSDNVFLDILNGSIINWPGSYMIRTSVWMNKYPSKDIYVSRYGQNIQMLLPVVYNNSVGYIDEPLMYYVVHSNSMTHCIDLDGSKRIRNSLGFQDIYINVLTSFCDQKDLYKYMKIIQATFSRSRMNIAITVKNDDLIKKYYIELKNTGLITINDKINYQSYFCPAKALIIKCLRRIHNLFD